MIQFTKTHIGYTLPALFSIDDILLEKNSVYILVGKNGSGKSTFLRTIIKHEKILQGEIMLNGKSIRWIRDNSISEHVAFVPTTFPQVDYLRVTEFVGMGRTPHTNALGRFSEKDHSIVKEALKMLNISKLEHKFTSELSDGERQLCAIAKAIAQETKIIILDEPTAFLDYSNKIKVLNILKQIAVEMNKCIILSSHDIDLSINANCPFLVLNKTTTKMEFLPPPIEKGKLILMAF
jgi:iron complex transport system ATP-binding protein